MTKKILIILSFTYITLLAETVPNEIIFYGEDISESNGKRIAGDEVPTTHNFKLSTSGWKISYRADGIGSFLGITSWIPLTYTGRVQERKGDNGEPRTLNKPAEIITLDGKRVLLLNPPNQKYEEWHFKFKEFYSADMKIKLRVFSDGEAVIFLHKDGLIISQNLKTYGGSGFMLGVYKNNN